MERAVLSWLSICHQRAEGHPLFTVELLNDLTAQRLLTQDRDGRGYHPSNPSRFRPFSKQLIAPAG